MSLVHYGKTAGLFFVTALCEIGGCYLPYLWYRQQKSAFLLIPAALLLMAFSWLLSLHPDATGRVYASYGGVYVCTAILWLMVVDRVTPTVWDLLGASICLTGMAIIMFSPRDEQVVPQPDFIDEPTLSLPLLQKDSE